jgi:glucose-6-phosphate isomerase
MPKDLTDHAARLRPRALTELAALRAGRATVSAADWYIDLSRHRLDADADAALIAFGRAAGLEAAAEALFSGAIVNPSENRPALHWALRAQAPVNGQAEAEAVRQSLEPALAFAASVRNGHLKTAGGERFSAVLHIGIGGSDFGPRLIADAFEDRRRADIALRFCANVDPYDLDRALAGLDPATTLVIGVSKSFGTEETLYNLARARQWLEAHHGAEAAARHLALVTAMPAKAKDWLGRADAALFDMPLSVGGRFSLWSAASLACMISLGPDVFRAILTGAAAMDAHVKVSPVAENAAMRLALLDHWNASVRGEPMRVVLAYANRLRMLPTYLQQLEMESNGKSVKMDGSAAGQTAPAVWGGEGSVGQHSYHQWLHQGAQTTTCEFILCPDFERDPDGINALAAHALAQAEVLANGRNLQDIQADEPDLPDAVARQKVHNGGRASTFMVHRHFGPEAFGALVALYEHRTYFAGHLWGINPFDQWGVERGKTMAAQLKNALGNSKKAADPVTAALIHLLK